MSQLHEALANFNSLVDYKTGIIKQVELVRGMELDPEVFLAHADPCNTTHIMGIKAANRGAACSANRDRAIVRACGESIERYCSSYFDIKSFKIATENELKKEKLKFIHTHDVYPFSNSQYKEKNFPFKNILPDSKVRWVEGINYLTKEKTLLPASCVYVPYLFDTAVEPFTHMPISTGLAAGTSLDYCIQKGIMEIIERDALMSIWNIRKPSPKIDIKSCYGLMPEIDAILDAEKKGGPQWHINVLTLDINVPIISAALINPGKLPLTSFGIAANQDPVYALLLALEEASLTRMLLNRSEEILTNNNYVHKNYNNLRGHMLAHATSLTLRKRLDFLTDSNKSISFESFLKTPKTNPVQAIKNLGLEIYYKDVTTSDIESYGFKVARTIIPGMQPLDNDHRYRFLGGQRRINIKNKYAKSSKLNNDPHPFP